MNLVAAAAGAVERMPLPDRITRAGIALLVDRTSRRLRAGGALQERAFAAGMAAFPIALNVDAANAQHYELPGGFFRGLIHWGRGASIRAACYDGAGTLAEAEERPGGDGRARGVAGMVSAFWNWAAAGVR